MLSPTFDSATLDQHEELAAALEWATGIPNQRVPLFGYELDAVDMPQAVSRIYSWVAAGKKTCRFVVTPNVDHSVIYQTHPGLQRAYANASLVLADGAPVVAAARMLGRPLPCRVAGSDLVPAIFDAAEKTGGLRAYLLGAGPGVAERAASNIALRWPNVQVVGTYSPPMGFEHDRRENDRILARISAAQPDILMVGLGAPKQELWVNEHRERIEVSVALCIGASIDFLAGEKSRAPLWMRRSGLEWVHRVATEPRRLLKRYARDAWIFPRLVARECLANWRSRRAQRHSSSG